MKARIASTLILWALTIGTIICLESLGLTVILALLSAAAIAEACAIAKSAGLRPMSKTIQLLNIVIFIGTWSMDISGVGGGDAGSLTFAISAAALSISLIKNPDLTFATKSFIPSLIILAAIPFMLQWYAVIAVEFQTPEYPYAGIILALWIIAAAKFSDVGAYVVGKGFGRVKLAPEISPNKTAEGALGGIFSAAALSATIAWLCAPMLPNSFSVWAASAGGIAIALAAIISDLIESVFKRRAGVKDSGKIIPGIGGALDLADSLLLSAPVGTAAAMLILSI